MTKCFEFKMIIDSLAMVWQHYFTIKAVAVHIRHSRRCLAIPTATASHPVKTSAGFQVISNEYVLEDKCCTLCTPILGVVITIISQTCIISLRNAQSESYFFQLLAWRRIGFLALLCALDLFSSSSLPICISFCTFLFLCFQYICQYLFHLILISFISWWLLFWKPLIIVTSCRYEKSLCCCCYIYLLVCHIIIKQIPHEQYISTNEQ